MDLILGIAAPLVAGVFLFLLKMLHSRIVKLEDSHMHKDDIRELIKDKVDDIRSDVKEIKDKIEKLFDLYISEKQIRP